MEVQHNQNSIGNDHYNHQQHYQNNYQQNNNHQQQQNNNHSSSKNGMNMNSSHARNNNSNGKSCFFLGDTQLGKKILDVIQGMGYSIFITIVTIITLFADDIRQIFFDSSADLAFSIITIVCMAIFTLEMIALSLLKEGYFLKYYFWLDLISTCTMILDLMWVSQLLNGGNGVQAAASVAKVARASRASKIGAKSTKLIRILRLIRLLKLMKNAQRKFNQKHQQRQQQLHRAQQSASAGFQNIDWKRQRHKVSTILIDRGDRKVSKRMERIIEASCSVIKSQKQNPGFSNQQVSLNCIGTQPGKPTGSTRKIQVANPFYRNHSGNLPAIQQLQDFEAKNKNVGKRKIPVSLRNVNQNAQNSPQQNQQNQLKTSLMKAEPKLSIVMQVKDRIIDESSNNNNTSRVQENNINQSQEKNNNNISMSNRGQQKDMRQSQNYPKNKLPKLIRQSSNSFYMHQSSHGNNGPSKFNSTGVGVTMQNHLTQNKEHTQDHHQNQHNSHSQYHSNKKFQSQHNLYDIPNQTKVGSKLKDQIQKNIISMILLILISIPIFNSSTWFDLVSTYDKSIGQLAFFKNNSTQFDIEASLFIPQMLQLPQPLVFFEVDVNATCCQFPRDYPDYFSQIPDITTLRADSINAVIDQNTNATAIYNTTPTNILSSQLSIGRTLFVCILLIISTLLFSRDVQLHALQPLENMITTVKNISNDPIHAIREIQQNKILQQEEFAGQAQQKQHRTQPIILEEMIVKISELLVIGLGQAGTQLMAKNIQNHGSLNVMMPGKKIMGIFGFCDIRNFTDATQVLQAQVMVFVNQIAQICHDVVNRNGGNPNKNIGDAFLLVWKFAQQDTQEVPQQNSNEFILKLKKKSLKVQQTADLAVFSFAKMIAQITKSHSLQKYKNHAGLRQRIKNYQGVKMGFGLHVGWAIQGPIGSQFKIDASYLSPNVNMASRLQAATKQYGVPILITGQIYDLMVSKNKHYLRHIDKVVAKGGQKPFDLYTIDLSIDNILKVFGVNAKKQLSLNDKQKIKVSHNKIRQLRLSRIQKDYFTPQLWKEDKDIKCMREPYSKLFFGQFKTGMDHYINGKWKQAHEKFKKTQAMAPGHCDGPSAALIKFMEESDFEAPRNWNGYRQFDE